MDDRFSQQLKKGVLEMLVLEILCGETTYGYDLMLKLRERSGGLFTLKEGTLYPILYRLEDDGLIRAEWSAAQGRLAPKKLYAVTDQGMEEQRRRREIWNAFSGTVNQFLGEE